MLAMLYSQHGVGQGALSCWKSPASTRERHCHERCTWSAVMLRLFPRASANTLSLVCVFSLLGPLLVNSRHWWLGEKHKPWRFRDALTQLLCHNNLALVRQSLFLPISPASCIPSKLLKPCLVRRWPMIFTTTVTGHNAIYHIWNCNSVIYDQL